LKALAELIAAVGLQHPSELRPHHVVRRLSPNRVALASALLEYIDAGALLPDAMPAHLPEVFKTYWPLARAESFHLIQ